LPDRDEAILDHAELQRDVREVLWVQAEVGIEVGHHRSCWIDPQLIAGSPQHRAAVGHGR
jgi:hypothetical protein